MYNIVSIVLRYSLWCGSAKPLTQIHRNRKLIPLLSLPLSSSTLRYANRAKNIKNKPRINEDPKDALLRQYREEIEKLKQMLSGGGGALLEATPTPEERERRRREWEEEEERRHRDWEAEREAISREYERKMAELRQQYDQ